PNLPGAESVHLFFGSTIKRHSGHAEIKRAVECDVFAVWSGFGLLFACLIGNNVFALNCISTLPIKQEK
ncbi:MAG: hypothetical protein OXU23_23275, partial [Candidatus Poribacteria bacterium]|nr:hypothetical protein [Candidatus Poribacteria bacterium]